tara:strand:- start:367 stop:540 length:174 start_codon:yes stop_codon:yes gene_type:complete
MGLTGVMFWVQDLASSKGVEVSVSPDGLGFDTFKLSDGEHLDTSESLVEAEHFVQSL